MQHDLIRLQHMLDAGKDALQFALGRERTHLLSKEEPSVLNRQ